MNLEDQLRDALRREDPPQGFAERVIQQAGPAPVQFRHAGPKWRFRFLWSAVAAAAAAALLFSIAVQYRRAQDARTAEQAIQALQIVAEELSVAQSQVLNSEVLKK
jgi:hypothetical protein